MDIGRRERWKLIALGVAIVVGAAYLVVRVAGDHEGRTDTPGDARAVVSRSLDSPPELVWTADPNQWTEGNTNDVWLAMPYTLERYYGYGGLLDAGAVLVAATAYSLPTEDPSQGSDVGAVTLVGVDPDDGAALWRTPVGRVSQCSQEAEDTVIACWGDRRVVFVDTADGSLVADVGTDFDLNGARVVDGTVYVSGTQNGTPILTAGTPTAIESKFRRTFDPADTFASVYVTQDLKSVILAYTGDGTPQYVYRVFDLESGAERFTYEGDSVQSVGNGLFLTSIGSESGTVGTQNLVAADGTVIRAVPRPSYGSGLHPVGAADSVPMFLGDGAYDPSTGDELWRNPAMVESQFSGTESAVAAVVGTTVVVTDDEKKTLAGIDVETGREKWVTPWEDAYWVRNGLTDGENFVFGDYQGMHSIDARTGEIGWSIPQAEGADPRSVTVSSVGGHLTRSWGNNFTVWE